MRFGNGLRLLCCLIVLSGSVYAQCFDLTSVQLYDLKGRFQERWDRPIWDAKPGEGNFHLDESPWLGGVSEFVIFAVGQVQKTPSGWVPLNRTKAHEAACDLTPERSDILCYWPPYQTPSANSRRMPPRERDEDQWTLTRAGILRFTIHSFGQRPMIHADAVTEALLRVLNQNEDLGSTFDAVLDLNTGAYSAVAHGHGKGYYTRHFPEGVELWRDTTLSARVKLVPQDCPASVRKAVLTSGGEVGEEEAHPVPICVVRAKSEGSQPSFDFILNPKNVSSPEGCIVAHEGPIPPLGVSVAKAQKH
jgi:hypothetical protein